MALEQGHGPGETLFVNPLHRAAPELSAEGILQGPTGIVGVGLQILEAQGLVQIGLEMGAEVFDACIQR